MSDDEQARTITIEERSAVPLDGLVLGYGPMLPFPAAVVAMLFGSPTWAEVAQAAVLLWGAAILMFLGGVRRARG